MAISFIQITKGSFTSAAASQSLSFSSGTSAGSIIVVAGSCQNNTQSVTISDNNSDAVTDSGKGNHNNASATNFSWIKAFFSPTTGTTTVTATFGSTQPTYGDLFIYEIGGLTSARFDKVVEQDLASSYSSGSTGTLTSANEAAICAFFTDGSMATVAGGFTTGQGSTVGSNLGDGVVTGTSDIAGHQVVSATTALTATATGTGNAACWAATFMSGGGGLPPGNMPGNPVYELALQTKFPSAMPQVQTYSWTWSFNLNLRGKDKLPAGIFPGEPVYQLPDRPPEQVQLHTWTWSFNLNLRGKDKLPAGVFPGEPVYNLPDRPPEQVQLHSWTWSFNLNLRGKDKFPPGIQPGNPVYELTWAQKFPSTLFQTWIQGLNPNLITVVQLPRNQYDWPLPIAPARLDQWVQPYNVSLYAPAVVQTVFRAPLRSLPDQPIPLLQTWTWGINPNLAAPPTPPLRQQDWPVPTQSWRLDQTWTASYNLNLVGKDNLPVGKQLYDLAPREADRARDPTLYNWIDFLRFIIVPFNQTDWPLPPTGPVYPQDLRTWTYSIARGLITAPPVLYGQAKQWDWPLPVAPPRLDQTWTAWFNLNLIGKDNIPRGAKVYDLPPAAPLRSQDLNTWIQLVNLTLITASPNLFNQVHQFDYPNPRGAEPDWRRSWEFSFNLNLIGKDNKPPGQQSYDRPQLTIPSVQTWIDQTKLALIAKPFNQQDWPNPTQPARDPTLTSWASSFNLNLIGQDNIPRGAKVYDLSPPDFPRMLQLWVQQTNLALLVQPPFNQHDWPLPQAPQQAALGWSWAYNLNLIGKDKLPFRQQDWPLPAGHTIPTLLQTWLFSRAVLYPKPQFPVGRQLYDRPQLRQDAPADQYFVWARYPIIPPPPPPVLGGSYRLLSDHYLYGVYYTANTVIIEGREVPLGWVPTLAVDPLDTKSVTAYWNAGPRNVDYSDLNTFGTMYKREIPTVAVGPPVTYWQQVRGAHLWQLTGLGSGLPPRG